MTKTYDAQIDVHGDILGVHWTGSVWQCPTTGSQHSREWDALAVELRHYLAACGEDTGHIDGQYVRDHAARRLFTTPTERGERR